MKRFTETEKWSDPWFVELDPKAKIFWLYLLDNCDSAGVWEIFERKFQFETGIAISVDALIEDLGSRVQVIGEKLLIPKFVKYQYGKELSESSNYHKGIIKRLDHHGFSVDAEGLVKGTPRVGQGLVKGMPRVSQPYSNPTCRVQDKDKDKDKVKDKDKGDARGKKIDIPFEDPRFVESWNQYLDMRKELKIKSLKPTALKAKFKEFEEWGLEMSIQSLKESLKNQWQGTFAPTHPNGQTIQPQKERNLLDVLE